MSTLDLAAPIVPGASVAGITLGDAIAPILARNAEVFDRRRVFDALRRPSGSTRYTSPSVDLWERAGVVYQIMAHGAYRGQVLGRLGLGATIEDIERLFGTWQEDEEDVLMITSLPGLWFEIEGYFPDLADPAFRAAPIRELGVFRVSSRISPPRP